MEQRLFSVVTIDYIRHSVPTSPQAMFFRTTLHQQVMFDNSLAVAADYEAICRMYLMNPTVVYVDDVIAVLWRGRNSNSIRRPLRGIRDMAKLSDVSSVFRIMR